MYYFHLLFLFNSKFTLQSYKKFLKQQAIPSHFQPPATTLAPCSLSSFTFAPNFKITDYQ